VANIKYGDEIRTADLPDREYRDYYSPARRTESAITVLRLPVAGLAVIGIGAIAWYYLGPDLRRYLKLRNM
jgi:hypothetical protein